jgi:predicted MFS family arabinose efflux permease
MPSFFTYLRPFLENVTHLSGNSISAVLLVYGVANLIAAIAAKFFLDRSIPLTLTLSPAVMATSTVLMIYLGADLLLQLSLLQSLHLLLVASRLDGLPG